MEKCAIFIDGGYLDKLLENWSSFKLDYLKFCEKIAKIVDKELLRVYYYNCLPIVRKMYSTNCSRCRKEIKINFKHDGIKKVYCERCFKDKTSRPYNFKNVTKEETQEDQEFYDKRERFYNKLKRLPHFEMKYGYLQVIRGKTKQKIVDVKMSLDIVDKCFDQQIHHAIIIAGDGDFIPAIKKAKDCGAVVHLFCNKNKVNRRLLFEVDKVYDLKLSFIKELEEK